MYDSDSFSESYIPSVLPYFSLSMFGNIQLWPLKIFDNRLWKILTNWHSEKYTMRQVQRHIPKSILFEYFRKNIWSKWVMWIVAKVKMVEEEKIRENIRAFFQVWNIVLLQNIVSMLIGLIELFLDMIWTHNKRVIGKFCYWRPCQSHEFCTCPKEIKQVANIDLEKQMLGHKRNTYNKYLPRSIIHQKKYPRIHEQNSHCTFLFIKEMRVERQWTQM